MRDAFFHDLLHKKMKHADVTVPGRAVHGASTLGIRKRESCFLQATF
jgi:hypothetical protein